VIFVLRRIVCVMAAEGATFSVTNVNDSGAGSLRQAIVDANANSGTDTIEFGMGGGGQHEINPSTALPAITEAVTIDGYTEFSAFLAVNRLDEPVLGVSGLRPAA